LAALGIPFSVMTDWDPRQTGRARGWNRALRLVETMESTRAGAPVDALFAELYAELRQLARGRLRHERPGHTLSATSLTHAAYERLAAQRLDQWQGRGHFLAMAATMMRRILVDHALARAADKRSAELVTLSAAEWVADDAA
ncbi:ECF-type sigma factor, partial [Escherichia coli]|uniref:ECF-type sigma factor n=1 Tax=Escherichia coli TaxID=562 RepID=UPI00192A68B3